MRPPVDVLLPVKPLARAKSRLRGAADSGAGDPAAHAALALALVRDTAAAAAASALVDRVLAVSADPVVREALARDGVPTVPDEPGTGLNAALRHGEQRVRDASRALAALQADLPALRAEELDAALAAGLAAGAGRAFCADRAGTGTTLLLALPGAPLRPSFGPGSAAAHRAGGARELAGDWPGLRCDVDTAADLALAERLGVGPCTRAVRLDPARPAC